MMFLQSFRHCDFPDKAIFCTMLGIASPFGLAMTGTKTIKQKGCGVRHSLKRQGGLT